MILMQEMLLFFQTALHRPVVSPAKEAAQNAVEASQNTGVAKVAETLRAAPVMQS